MLEAERESKIYRTFGRPSRDPDYVIGPRDDPYMLRWWIIPRNETFNVYYHRVLKDDDDRALHDHPWPSFSIMTQGELVEHTVEDSRVIRAGDAIYRGPEFAHRLALIDGKPAETLFITGPRLREWGFHCPKGWIPWGQFVAADKIGRGCGED